MKYPDLTPYQFASNTPIQAIDLDGLEAFRAAHSFDMQHPEAIQKAIDNKSLKKLKPVQPQAAPAHAAPAKAAPAKKN
jgi:hypothetical protein